jgi:hypothetical protein
LLRVLGVAGTPIQSRVDFHRQPRQERRECFDPGRRSGFLFSKSCALSFDREEMLCTVCNTAGALSCHVRTHICQVQARSATYCRSERCCRSGRCIFPISNSRQHRAHDVRSDQVQSGRCCRSGKCRRSGRCSQSGDRTDIADQEDYQCVADQTNVPDREIGKILPIGKNDCLIHFQKQFSIEFE